MKKSLLMQDSWRSNHGYEAMLDFQMSWLMRLAAEKSEKQERLHEISKQVLLRLIEEKNERVVEVERVEVWRQWESIDVIAEVDIKVNDVVEHHLVVIEDKAYTLLYNNQLARYTKAVSDHYEGKPKPKYHIHYWVITFYDKESSRWEKLDEECKRNYWNLLSFYDVIGWNDGEEFKDTESDLFNEFWLREWY